MLKKPLIVGAKGGMGRRYAAILRTLQIEPLLMDVGDDVPEGFDSVIIASPTDLHAAHCLQFMAYRVPILCEKPLSKEIGEVERVCSEAERLGVQLDMVNQYRYCEWLSTLPANDYTSYNFFNTGKDGLAWDCISIIALANGKVSVDNTKPVWSCVINGHRLRYERMDWAYITMIQEWLAGSLRDHGKNYILNAHNKVLKYIEDTK
jgi:hypothetical protein